jgi:hypothetical protein
MQSMKQNKTGFIVRYDSGAYLARTGLPYLSPDALNFDPNEAHEFASNREAEVAVIAHGQSMLTIGQYSRAYWRRLCRAYSKANPAPATDANSYSNCGRTFVVRPVWHSEDSTGLRANSFDTVTDGCADIGRNPDAFGVYELTGPERLLEWIDDKPTLEEARTTAARLASEAEADVIGWIAEQMADDTEDRLKQSARLRNDYEAASAEVRAGIDAAFICLCGYSLATAFEQLGVSINTQEKKS